MVLATPSHKSFLNLVNDRDQAIIKEAFDKIFKSTPTTQGKIYGIGISGDTKVTVKEIITGAEPKKHEMNLNGLRIKGIYPDSRFSWEILGNRHEEGELRTGLVGNYVDALNRGLTTEITCRSNEIIITLAGKDYLKEIKITPAPGTKIRIGTSDITY